MREIIGKAKTVRELLTATKYSIDYYQREYKWQEKQVQELLDDLTIRFLDDYDPDHERRMVRNYGHYFLGSIIISDKNERKFIVDGQQRLTTLTLLLIYVHNQQRGRDDASSVDQMIYSEQFGEKTFNIEVEERAACMEALFEQQPFDATDKPESVQNILARYQTISEYCSNDLTGRALPYFVDWLKENVHLVEITAFSDDDAYTIFETMNDRGLSLSETDMLKGYLLANISDTARRDAANTLWKRRIADLAEVGKDADADFFKAWLRSQYAMSIRERKKDARPGEFDRIGTEFHRWVREHRDRADLALSSGAAFAQFIERDFDFYARHYRHLMRVAWRFMPGLEHVFYNARLGFTTQYTVLLAPLVPGDTDEVAHQKFRLVAIFLDILLNRRIWNWHNVGFSTMQYAMYLVTREIRRKPVDELAQLLYARLTAPDEETFASNERFAVHQQNRWYVQLMLARMTGYIEEQSGATSHYTQYIGSGSEKFEVEHIWANKYERHTDEFSHPQDFADYRNRIGDLLVLPKKFNASYGALPYEEKLEHYFGQNLLAQSLHPRCYDHNPGFIGFMERSGLPFAPCEHFHKADLAARQALYAQLAACVWDPEQLLGEVGE